MYIKVGDLLLLAAGDLNSAILMVMMMAVKVVAVAGICVQLVEGNEEVFLTLLPSDFSYIVN